MTKIIAKIDRSRYKTSLSNGRHTLFADEPEPYGKDAGPTPYDYLLKALGSCMAMTLRMYADRKKWDLETVEIHLTQERVYHKDCEECESEEGYVHIIHKSIELSGNLDSEQKTRLLEMAEKCPVHKTLMGEIKILNE